MRALDLTNKRYGRLLAIEPAGTTKNGKRLWLMACDCGNECIVIGSDARSGNTMSCGCVRIENAVANGLAAKKEVLDYRGAHVRVVKSRGKASEYTCTCGAQAVEWSYDHSDESEIRGPWKFPGGRVREVAWSMDHAHYKPLCRSCHVKADRKGPNG